MDARSFEIDPDIRRATTLPGRFYTDAAVFEHLRESLFARSWQCVGDKAGLAERGDVRPFTLLEGVLDEELLLVRGGRAEIACLSNVCTHRGNLVVGAPGRKTSLQCAYHGRRFDLDGSFRSMPEFEGAQCFPRADEGLAKLPLESLGPLLFTSLNPAHPFPALVADVAARMAWLPLDEFVPAPELSKDYTVNAHWALYCDNYLEGFHIPFLHPTLNAAVDFDTYTTTLFAYSSVQVALARKHDVCFEPPPGSPDHGRRVAAYYWWLFPNLMLNFYPWGLSVNSVRPTAIDRTRVSFRSYVWKRELVERGAGSGLHQVEMEDEAVVEAVQRGVRSRLYTRGRYSPTREQAVHHFHRLLVDALR